MEVTGELIVWQFIRAAGLLGYLLLSVSVFMGIALKSRFLDGILKRAWVYEAHQSITIASFGLILLHLALVLLNSYVAFGLLAALVPFVSAWKPVPTALGIVGFYLTAALIVSSFARGFIGYRAWRLFHYAAFIAWFAALLHGVTAGSDSGLAVVRMMYWLSAAFVLLATIYRILIRVPPKRSTGHLLSAKI